MVSKMLGDVLTKVSEDNNAYRVKLRNLNKTIDEKTTALVGDIVTLSNYTIDFSSTLVSSKEKIVEPISKVIESYVIKDLRSVETVNEQFVDKINYKISQSNINSVEEKNNFIENLRALLNDKYLQIVNIKRVSFLNENNLNDDIENSINDFLSNLKIEQSVKNNLDDLIVSYKNSLYDNISLVLNEISNLYLKNFLDAIMDSANNSIDVNDNMNTDSFKPYMPEINPNLNVEIPNIPEVPLTPDELEPSSYNLNEENKDAIPVIPDVPEIPAIPDVINVPEVPIISDEKTDDASSLMDIPSISPIEVDEPKKEEAIKKTYDVDEILKIAKSPVVTMPTEEKNSENEYLNVSQIAPSLETESFNSEFDEKEIVEEMISRLNKRLAIINERTEKYNEEKRKLKEDETFVNDLIESSNNKHEQLDKFEEELNAKEKEIGEKQKELDKKINDVLPFADAIMKTDKKED